MQGETQQTAFLFQLTSFQKANYIDEANDKTDRSSLR